MTWDGVFTKTHKYYLKELGINSNIEAYMQSLVLRKTLESISLDHRRKGEITNEEQTEIMNNAEVEPSNEDKVNQSNPEEVEKVE